MKNLKSASIALLFGSIFLYQQEWIAGGAIIGLAIYLIYKEIQNPKRAIEKAIQMDEMKFKTKIPTSYPLYLSLINLYSKYLSFQTHYPILKITYQEKIASMWKMLATKSEICEWKRIIEEVEKSWPIPVDVQRFTS